MNKEIVKEIILINRLIPGPVSRKILRSIVYGEEIPVEIMSNYVAKEEIDEIRKAYRDKLSDLKNSKPFPKYLPFYLIIKEKMFEFDWKILNNSGKNNIKLISPKVRHLRPSLLSLLLGKVDLSQNTILHQKYQCINQLPISIIKKLDLFMRTVDVVYPIEEEMLLIVNLIKSSAQKNDLTIFIPICPDYSVEATNDPACPFRHTFNSLGNKNGQIAQRILGIISTMKELFDAIGLKINIVVGMADFEGFSEENLQRVGLSKSEFLEKVNSSRNSFLRECKEIVSSVMISDWSGGEGKWISLVNWLKEKFALSDFGKCKVNQNILLEIAEKRKQLYSRWYGVQNSLSDYAPIVLNQGAEYAAMGYLIANKFENCLVIGADNDVMKYFYSFSKPIPTLYLKRFYC